MYYRTGRVQASEWSIRMPEYICRSDRSHVHSTIQRTRKNLIPRFVDRETSKLVPSYLLLARPFENYAHSVISGKSASTTHLEYFSMSDK